MRTAQSYANNKLDYNEPKSLGEIQRGVCEGERPVIEMMGITSDRLRDVERKVTELSNWLFGAYPVDECCGVEPGPSVNVASLASASFGSSVRIEQALDEIYRRLTGHN